MNSNRIIVCSISVCCIVMGLNVKLVSAAVATEPPPNNTSPPEITLKGLEKSIDRLVGSVTKMVLPYLVRNSDLKLTPKCMSTFIKLFVDIRKLKLPAIQLLDAMAKPPYGLIEGNFAIFGDYDECLGISVDKKGEFAKSTKQEVYHGNYCTVEIQMPKSLLEAVNEYGHGLRNISDFGKLGSYVQHLPTTLFAPNYFTFHAGICMPSTCSIGDLQEIIKLIPVTFLPIKVERCEDNSPKVVTLDQYIVLSILGIILVFVLLGTCLDAILHIKHSSLNDVKKGKLCKCFLSFSAYSNTQKWLTSKDTSDEVSCINGMFVTGTFLVVTYHVYFLPFFLYFSRSVSNLGHYFNDPGFTLISTMAISIEAYFLFSGFFLVYGRFKRRNIDARINVFKLIIRRYLRLCPSLLLILGLILVLPVIGKGPVFADIFDVAAENTRKWWWTYALMFNNFLKAKDQNFLYLWFIPCLMQITVIGVILAWVLSKNKKLGMILIVGISLACNVVLGVLTALYKYPPSYAIYYFIVHRENFEIPIYTSPLSHVVSFCVGMLLAYYMGRTETLKLSKVQVVVGWIFCLVATVGIQWVLFICHDGKPTNVVFAALYGATHKTIFSLGMAWIIVACTYGYGGVLGKLLCWSGFSPLSKLGYLAYLAHYLVISFHVSEARSPMSFSHYEIWMRILSYVTLTFMVAYVMYIFFELPLIYLESLILPQRKSPPELETRNHNGKDQDIIRFQTTNNNVKNATTLENIYSHPVKIVLCEEQSHL